MNGLHDIQRIERNNFEAQRIMDEYRKKQVDNERAADPTPPEAAGYAD